MMTLEGVKKIVINKSIDKGQNIYSIESNRKNYPKLNLNKRFFSSKQNIINNKDFNLHSPNDEYAGQIKFKNAKVIYLSRSESHKFLAKKKLLIYLLKIKMLIVMNSSLLLILHIILL